MGDYETAKKYHEISLKLTKELCDRSGELKAYGNLGNANYSLGDVKTAMENYESELKIAKELNDRLEEGKAYGNLSSVHLSMGDLSSAIEDHKRSLKIANELGNRSGEGTAYGNLGNVHHRKGDLSSAIQCHERSLKIAKESSDPLLEGISHYDLGNCFELLGQVEGAITHYKLAVSLLNNLRDSLRLSLRDQYQTIYAALWRLMLAEGKATEALVSAEHGRAQGLKDLLRLNYEFEVCFAESDKENSPFHEPTSGIPPNTIFMAMTKQCLIFWVFQRQSKFALRSKPIIFQDDINTFFQSLVKKIGPSDEVQCEDRSLELARDKSLLAKRSPQDDRQT